MLKIVSIFVKNVCLNGKPKSKAPLYVLGHSMGGLIVPHFMIRNPGLVDRAIFTAPMFDVFGLKGVPDFVLRTIAFTFAVPLGKTMEFVLGAKSKTTHMVPSVEEGNDTSSCQARLDNWNKLRKENPIVVVGGVTWGWLFTSTQHRFRHNTLYREQVEALEQTPILILKKELDTIVSNPAIDEFSSIVRSTELETIAGSKHEAFFEVNVIREFAMERCIQFLTSTERSLKPRKGSAPLSKTMRKIKDAIFWIALLFLLLVVFYAWITVTKKVLSFVGLM